MLEVVKESQSILSTQVSEVELKNGVLVLEEVTEDWKGIQSIHVDSQFLEVWGLTELLEE